MNSSVDNKLQQDSSHLNSPEVWERIREMANINKHSIICSNSSPMEEPLPPMFRERAMGFIHRWK